MTAAERRFWTLCPHLAFTCAIQRAALDSAPDCWRTSRLFFHPSDLHCNRDRVIKCKNAFLIFVLAMVSLPSAVSEKIYLNGAGASFPAVVYEDTTSKFQADRRRAGVDISLKYLAVGSGNGKQLMLDSIAKTIPESHRILYAGSDSELHEEDYEKYPGLQMFPSLAGAIIIAYHLPIQNSTLRLTSELLLGIFNGTITYWDDSHISKANPQMSLPHQSIVVIARRLKSGSTKVITKYFSEISEEWAKKYGVFENGINSETWKHEKWPSHISFFGATSTEILALLSSIRYSIGYISMADTVDNIYAHVKYTTLQNKDSKFVEATTESVQAAMDYFSDQMTSRMTVSILNGGGNNTYPLSTYTYFITRMNYTSNCSAVTEFYIYVQRYFNDYEQSIKDKKMVPLTKALQRTVMDKILNKITCSGQLVKTEADQKLSSENENTDNSSWLIPMLSSVLTIMVVVIVLASFIGYNRYQVWKLINQDDWFVPIEEILFMSYQKSKDSRGSDYRSIFSKSIRSDADDESWDSDDESVPVSMVLQWPGRFRGNMIGVRMLETKIPRITLKTKQKRTILWLRDKVQHSNVVRCFGLTSLDDEMLVVSEYLPRGSLESAILNERHEFNDDVKSALGYDIARAMSYLNSIGISHGTLRSRCCMLDAKWTVKVADWEYDKLFSSSVLTRDKSVDGHIKSLITSRSSILFVKAMILGVSLKEATTPTDWDLYVAPEIISSNYGIPPNEASDVYSYAILLYEIFNRVSPYVDVKDSFNIKHLIHSIIKNSLRPISHDEVPISVRQIIEIAWSDSPTVRPNFESLCKMLKKAFPRRKQMLESMVNNLEQQARNLESEITQKNMDIMMTRSQFNVLVRSALPNEFSEKLIKGDGVDPVHKKCVGVLVVDLLGLIEYCKKMNPVSISNLLNEVNDMVQQRAQTDESLKDVFALNLFSPEIAIFCFGLNRKTTRQNVSDALSTAFKLLTHDWVIDPSMSPGDFGESDSPITLALRCCVHCGPLTLSIVGSSGPKLSAFGETIHSAIQLLYTSKSNSVLVSEAVRSVIESSGDYCFVQRNTTIKTKESRSMSTYWCRKKEEFENAVQPPAEGERPSIKEILTSESQHSPARTMVSDPENCNRLENLENNAFPSTFSVNDRHSAARRSLSEPVGFLTSMTETNALEMERSPNSDARKSKYSRSSILNSKTKCPKTISNGMRKVTFPGGSNRIFTSAKLLTSFTDIDQLELSRF